MDFQFVHYTASELEACGQAFKNRFAATTLSKTPEWTCAVFDWFRNSAAPGIRVFPPATGRKEEFLVDLCHTTYPLRGNDESWPCLGWYERTVKSHVGKNPVGMMLALESEWGKWGVADQSLVMFLDDACKLAVLRATTKVMIFSSHWGDERSRVPSMLSKLRACHGDTDPWLWLDVPNERQPVSGTLRDIQFGVFQ